LGNILNVRLVKESKAKKASRSFRRLIKDLFTKNPKNRIGERIEEFKQHSFFEGFEWDSYFREKESFSYAKNYMVTEEEFNFDSISSDDDFLLKEKRKRSLDKTENYNIEDFTYETSFSKESKSNMLCLIDRPGDTEVDGEG
jgi:hypothetical protein